MQRRRRDVEGFATSGVGLRGGLKSQALSNEKRLDAFASNRLMYWRARQDESNGMDAPFLKRHQGAKVEMGSIH